MKFKAHDQFITAIAIQPETDKMVSGDIDGTIRVWRTIGDTQNEVIRKPDRRTLGVTALAFNPGSSILACGITYSLTNGKVEI